MIADKVGVVGLGLIGGSIARAYKNSGWTVYGFDTDGTILSYAGMSGVIDGVLDAESLKDCGIVHLAVSPAAAVGYLGKNAHLFNKDGMVIDDCGTKRMICEAGFGLAKQNGFTFVGGHPMAGTHLSGFKNSRANMFSGASMVVVPPVFDDIELLNRIKRLLEPMGLRRIVFTTAEQHDKMIAYTSQLAHVVSSAYVKSPTALQHKGYSAGSFRDMTRVSWLNENMWTELFLENRDFLGGELRLVIENLTKYAEAIEDNDGERLRGLLREGRIAKEQCDKQPDTL